jgi:aspartate racemase
MIGVLGGMGPLATADFFSKVIAATKAARDDDHVPLLIQSDPRIPPRPAAILHGALSPLSALLQGRDRLIAAGATALAMPCNTAHYWYPQLVADCPVPFISIVDACCEEAARQSLPGSKVGLIATGATLAANLFDSALSHRGFDPLLPSQREMIDWILPGIELVKSGQVVQASSLIAPAVQALLDRGASVVVLACTETPVALDATQSPLRSKCIDSTGALARACVAWWMKQRQQ